MSTINQDFECYSGDEESPIFTVLDASSVAIDISSVNDIAWFLYSGAGAIVLTKLKSTGGIAFTNSGSDGKFTVALTKADTAALAGWYFHGSRLTDNAGNLSTVAAGRLLVKNRALGD